MGGLGQAMIATRSQWRLACEKYSSSSAALSQWIVAPATIWLMVFRTKAIALVARLIADRGLQPHSPLRSFQSIRGLQVRHTPGTMANHVVMTNAHQKNSGFDKQFPCVVSACFGFSHT